MEEAGVRVGKLEYHSSQPWPFPSNIMIGLIGNATCDDIKVDEVELEDAKYVPHKIRNICNQNLRTL